jgi:peptidoglycan endopeptidase LytE
VQYIYYVTCKIKLGTTTREQVKNGTAVKRNNLRRGDLLFFTNADRAHLSGNERIGHVALYLGDNYILHTASDYAVIEPISKARWANYITARRVV